MLFLPDGISGLPMPRYFENALWLLTGRTRIPSPSLSNSSLSPLRTPSTRRISRGTVICPLLVIVACFCIVSPHSPYFTTNALLWPTRDSGRSRVTDASQRLTRRKSDWRFQKLSTLTEAAHNSHTEWHPLANTTLREVAPRLFGRGDARQRTLRKKYTWLVQSISPTLAASELRARTSPPRSAGEIVFSSTKITPP
jgi:hypothetical protein